MPNAGTFAEWRRDFISIATSASGRGETCTAWLCQVGEKGSIPDDFVYIEPKWRSSDAKLATAIKAVVKGDLEVRIAQQMDICNSRGKSLSGRGMLCMLYREFEPKGRQYNKDSLRDVYDLKMANTLPGLEAYCSRLDALML
eukprot:1904799-Heterocapsa_arctica.AAC.1